ncbi:MAG TPA: potassium channel protein [Phycicoccus sp.]|nr:potassium channel protein [Phycicoccus sp.]
MTRPSESHRRRMLLSGVPEGAHALRRVIVSLSGLVAVVVLGTLGYMAFGLDFIPALYQTVFTVATVGYVELYDRTPAVEVYTIVLILVGVGLVLYNLGVLVEAVTEGHLREYLRRRRMDHRIAALRGHVIVCGYGRVGSSAATQLVDTGQTVVVVDLDATRANRHDGLVVIGDATSDETLRAAGIDHARALVCALESDASTMYSTLSARALRKDLVIISRARTVESKEKLVLAGATRAVNPQLIGGRRMASFALHADVAEFLDEVMHDDDIEHRIDGVRLPAGSPLIGRLVDAAELSDLSGVQLLAVRRPHRGEFIPTPARDVELTVGCTLIVFGTPEQVARLREVCRA